MRRKLPKLRKRSRDGVTPTTSGDVTGKLERPGGKAKATATAKATAKKKAKVEEEEMEETGAMDEAWRLHLFRRNYDALKGKTHSLSMELPPVPSSRPNIGEPTARWFAMRVSKTSVNGHDVHAELEDPTSTIRAEDVDKAWVIAHLKDLLPLDIDGFEGDLPDERDPPKTILHALTRHGLEACVPARPGLREQLRHEAEHLQHTIHQEGEQSDSTVTFRVDTARTGNTKKKNTLKKKLRTLQRGARDDRNGKDTWGNEAGVRPTSLINERSYAAIQGIATRRLSPLSDHAAAGDDSSAYLGYAKVVYTKGTVRNAHSQIQP